MVIPYIYELWNGKEVVGYLHTTRRLHGKFAEFRTVSTFKQPYGRKTPFIKVPLIFRTISTTHSDFHYRQVLDVRKKSKAQIELLKTVGNLI